MRKAIIAAILFLVIQGCDTDPNKNSRPEVPLESVQAPEFNADSSFAWLTKQVEFGPRVPNSPGHLACKDWLVQQLGKSGAEVNVQQAKVTAYDATVLDMYNIIAVFNPEQKFRILLCAHWDTRHIADQDTSRQNEPILGASDGASGVAVLLEIARQLSQNPIGIGVDIILFDTEDYGNSATENSYCLGSQYWSENSPTYKARYGILLDMVGGKDAVFAMEGTSMQYAPAVMRMVWDVANKIGYSANFSFEKTQPLIDDHFYINRIKRIPTIDIIQHDFNTHSHFAPYWHTHRDNLDAIDRKTLKAVGQTVLTVLYFESAKQAALNPI